MTLGPTCIECGGEGQLVDGRRIYPHRPDLHEKWFYLCACGAYCGCHPGGKSPLGSPCGPVTRRARSAAHAAFDPLWKRHQLRRGEAYGKLAELLGMSRDECHIGMMNAEQASRVPAAVDRIKATLREGVGGHVEDNLRAARP